MSRASSGRLGNVSAAAATLRSGMARVCAAASNLVRTTALIGEKIGGASAEKVESHDASTYRSVALLKARPVTSSGPTFDGQDLHVAMVGVQAIGAGVAAYAG